MRMCARVHAYVCMEIPPFITTWVELEGIMLVKISETEKYKYCVITYMWN